MKRMSWTMAVGLALSCTSDDGSDAGDDAAATQANGESGNDAGDEDAAAADDDDDDDDASAGANDDNSGDDDDDDDTNDADTGDDDDTSGDDDDDDDTSGDDDDDDDTVRPGPDFRELGPHTVASASDTESLSSGCTMAYDRRTPDGVADPPTVILAHGFQGNRGTMVSWAEHLASWGFAVITPDLCHSTIFDADHPANGADMVLLADVLGVDAPIYAGYSAGGLAAVIAASQDASTLGLLGLDMVDNGDSGLMAAPNVSAPALALIGEPAQCNSNNNGLAVFSMIGDATRLRLVDSDHCDYQSPADFLCDLTCSPSNAGNDDADIAATLVGLATGFAMHVSGLDDTGAQWLTEDGPWLSQLVADGLVEPLD